MYQVGLLWVDILIWENASWSIWLFFDTLFEEICLQNTNKKLGEKLFSASKDDADIFIDVECCNKTFLVKSLQL